MRKKKTETKPSNIIATTVSIAAIDEVIIVSKKRPYKAKRRVTNEERELNALVEQAMKNVADAVKEAREKGITVRVLEGNNIVDIDAEGNKTIVKTLEGTTHYKLTRKLKV